VRELTRAFFAAHPDLTLAALGARDNARALDLCPFGQPARYLAAEDEAGENGALIERYRVSNEVAFAPTFTMPGWVLVDLFLLPGAIGLLLGPARRLPEATRARLGLLPEDETILAGYFAAASLTPGRFAAASLFCLAPGFGAGAWIKALTLRMLRAERLRGVVQWENASVVTHARLGALELLGPAPAGHERAADSFLYELDLRDEARLQAAMERRLALPVTRRMAPGDREGQRALLGRVARGEVRARIVPPGRDAAGAVLLEEG
jgi:hypothetical protein